jgi:hypothetical protein
MPRDEREIALPDEHVFPTPPRLVAVGDLEGNAEGLETILRATGLAGPSGRWAGGEAHLVQIGDVFGRGSDPKACSDRLRRLAREARRSGGRVHCLLGNHEAEVVHRFELECDAHEYLAFATERSRRLWFHRRDIAAEGFWAVDEAQNVPLANLVAAWELLHPLGREEFRKAVAPTGRYGRWLCSLPACVKIGPLVFSHAGIMPEWAEGGMARLNARVRREMKKATYFPEFPGSSPLLAPEGPLWNRAYAWGRRGAQAALRKVLAAFGASAQVIGHTPTRDGRILLRYSRRVVCIDTKIGRPSGGRLSALVVEDGTFWAVYPSEGRKRLGKVPRPLGRSSGARPTAERG